MTTLGLVVPCRNEQRVIARKLANLARCRWPSSSTPHRVVIVDDGSDDETRATAGRAAQALASAFGAANVLVEVLENDVRPGKTGAIEQGLRVLGDAVDTIVLSDADVVLAPDALVELVLPLETDGRAGMSSGAQRMVAELAPNGALADADGLPLASRTSFYDALTAVVRRVESSAGAVFSVHGQLMAWRASLGLRPTRGLAADDLDLMLQARCHGQRVVFAPRALFYEERPSTPEHRRAQQTRRARAFLQFLDHPRRAQFAKAGPLLWRLQAALYLHLRELSAAVLVACFAAYVATWVGVWPPWAAWSVRIGSLGVSLPLALAVQQTLGRAREAASGGRPLKDRWETVRK